MKIFPTFLISFLFLLTACGESENLNIDNGEFVDDEYNPSSQEMSFEQLIYDIDQNDSLRLGHSLSYSREDGASMEVTIYVNAKNETVKLVEQYVNANSPSISSNVFHFKSGAIISSKELFEEGEGEDGYFVERITYYNIKEEPIITKRKTAPYEDQLDNEVHEVVEKHKCYYDKAMRALERKGEFSVTFQGFVKEEPYLYLIVGENTKNGYYSPLVVQYMTPLIKKLQEDEVGMLGTPLSIDFDQLSGAEGYEYQILLSASIRK